MLITHTCHSHQECKSLCPQVTMESGVDVRVNNKSQNDLTVV